MFEVYGGVSERLPLSGVADHARRVEALGYDGMNVPEAVHDGLLAAHAALDATEHLKVATSVLVAFPRSPMATAVAAWDLQEASGGRFVLGLGPQVRGNIVKRYSTPWSAPAPRMREYVNALRAIFASWQDGAELDFQGEHYRFSRMQPFFNPGPLGSDAPPIFLGAVGPNMVALVGEVADGMVTHPTNGSPRYLREVIIPSLERGANRIGRNLEELRLMVSPPTATGRDAEAVAVERERQREMLTFLFSTPSYWQSLDLFGMRDKGEALHALTREGRWQDMAGIIDDEMLDTFVVSGSYDEIADRLIESYGGLVKSITFPVPADAREDEAARRAIRRLQGRN